MKVILLQDVRGKGKKGQMLEVSDGYARNYMLPRKIAVEATPDNINTMRMNDKALLERQTKERAEAVRIMNEMKEVTLTLRVKGGGGNPAMAGAQISGKQMSAVITELVSSIDQYFED